MKIAVHLPVYRRYTTLLKACDSLDRLLEGFRERGIESMVYMIGHELKMKRLASNRGYEWVQAPNKPLGAKFNAGVKAMLKDKSWTHLMEYCSDNVVDQKYVDLVADRMEAGEEFIGLFTFYIYNSRTGQTLLFGRKAYTNVGRMSSRVVVERAKRRCGYWFEPRINSRLDTSWKTIATRHGRAKPTFIQTDHPLIVDIKDQGSMHPFKSFLAKANLFPVVHLVGEFPEINLNTENDGTTNGESPV